MKSKLAYLGLFSAVAIIFGYVESLIPFFMGIPGIKLGLANLAVLFLLQKYSVKEAALVSVVRILVIGFMFGNLFSILYSLAGALLSLKKDRFQSRGRQCGRRNRSQCGTAHHRHAHSQQPEPDLLCAGTFNLRRYNRYPNRKINRRSCKKNPLRSMIPKGICIISSRFLPLSV